MRKYFNDYLNEKITKKEFEEVLLNKNILSGCEFEFYLDYEKPSSNSEGDQTKSLMDKCDAELDKFRRRLRDYTLQYSRKEEEYELARDKVDALEADIEKIKNKQNGLNVPDKTMTKEYNQYTKKFDILQDGIDKKQKDVDKFEEIVREWEDGETKNYLINKYNPIPTYNNTSSLKSLLNKLSYDDFSYWGRSDIDKINQYLGLKAMEYQEIPYIDDILFDIFFFTMDEIETFYSDTSSNYIPDAETLKNEYKFPVKIERGWEVKEDGSLGDRGMEISTGIYQVKDLINIIEKVFKGMEKYTFTDVTCGFHVHLSMKSKHPIDPLKLILFVEEDRIYKDFEDRMYNSYAKSIKDAHINKLNFTIDDLRKIAKKENIEKNMNLTKYLGLHLIELEKNHVEFRYIGGENYEKKFKEIRTLIVNYAFGLSIACDLEFKRKEFLTKAARLVDYYESSFNNHIVKSFGNKIYYIEMKIPEIKKNKQGNKIVQMAIDPYKKKIKKFATYLPTIDTNTFDIENNVVYDVLLYFNLQDDKRIELPKPKKLTKLSSFLRNKK